MPSQILWVNNDNRWVSYADNGTAATSVFYYPFTFVDPGLTSTTVPVWSNVYGNLSPTLPSGMWWLDDARSVRIRVVERQQDLWTPAAPAIRRSTRRIIEQDAANIIATVQQARDASKARRRAEALLLSHLSPEQQKTFLENGWFIVTGGKTKRQYRIRGKHGIVANIDAYEGDRITHRLCGHAVDHRIPVADQLLAQKFMLECDEDEFLKIANTHAVQA